MGKIYYINDLGYQNGYFKFDNHMKIKIFMKKLLKKRYIIPKIYITVIK